MLLVMSIIGGRRCRQARADLPSSLVTAQPASCATTQSNNNLPPTCAYLPILKALLSSVALLVVLLECSALVPDVQRAPLGTTRFQLRPRVQPLSGHGAERAVWGRQRLDGPTGCDGLGSPEDGVNGWRYRALPGPQLQPHGLHMGCGWCKDGSVSPGDAGPA